MWQDARKMREESLVDSKHTLGRDRLVQAVEDALIQVARLVVHSRHDRICRLG